MSTTTPPSDKCLTKNCTKPALWKGLCRSCYGQAMKLIEKDKTSWEELAELGLISLEEKPFTKAFLEAKARQTAVNSPDKIS